MTENKNWKRRVRARQEADGITYSEALRRVRAEDEAAATPETKGEGSLFGDGFIADRVVPIVEPRRGRS